MSNKANATDMKEDCKPALVPKLRFPEFRKTNGWREGRISDIAEVLQGYGFPERYQGQTTGEYPFYKVSDISSTLAAGRVFIEESANCITEDVLKELKAKPIPEGTTIFAKIGEAIRSNRRAITKKKCLIDNNVAGVKRIQGKSTDLFMYFTMETISLIDYSGGVVPSVNKSAIENIAVKFPVIGEQQKISECLSSVDELIVAQARKLDALKTHKKGLMQLLFPRDGETQPRLRFPEFQDAGGWEEKRLEDLAKRASGHTPSKSKPEYYNGGIKWVSLADSKRLDLGLISETAIEISGLGIENSSAVLHQAGTVLISRDAGVGKSAIMSRPMAVSQHFIVWTCDRRLLSNWFLYHLLQKSKPLFERAATGSTIKTIGLQFFIDLRFWIPSLPEQQRIAECLNTLNELIAAQTKKLVALKTQRKGMLQQLFPSSEKSES